MGVFDGNPLAVRIETAVAGVFVPVNGLNRYQRQTQRSDNRFPVFTDAPVQLSGERVATFSIGGFWDDADAGQVRVRLLADTHTPAKIRVLPDGTNGFECTIQVTSYTGEASADVATLQGFTFDCEMTDAAATPIGTGIIV